MINVLNLLLTFLYCLFKLLIYLKLINYIVEIDEIRIFFKRKIITLIFQIDDFIDIIHFHFNLLKLIAKNVIRYFITHSFKPLKLLKFLITL